MTKKEQIIKEYNKVKLVEVRPSYGTIAKKAKCTKAYAWDVVQDYLKQKHDKN